MPLRGVVFYPMTALPLTVGQPRSVRLVEDAVLTEPRIIGLVASKDADIEEPTPDQIYRVGTAVMLHRLHKTAEGIILFVHGIERIRIDEYTTTSPYLKARVTPIPETTEKSVEVEALMRNLVELFRQLVSLVPYLSDEVTLLVSSVEDPRHLANLIATSVRMDIEDAQSLLEIDDVKEKLRRLTTILGRELEVLELGKKIQKEAQGSMEKVQREYFLREQLKAIRRELGEEDEQTVEIEDYRMQIKQVGMPEEAEKEALRELSRMEKMPIAAAEYSVIKTYLDWMVNLPWSRGTEDNLDVAHARQVLNEDHYGLGDVKDRILEFLAVRKLRQERKEDQQDTEPTAQDLIRREREGVILCFVGPPGVGKTSLGRSIARAMNRKFIRQSLGGIRDEAEVRGFRRTYVGSMPGRIIQALRRAESKNPVFMLDEVDKIGSDWRGDPSSALLEVLDPEQNNEFRDHYLDVPFDLSQVMFVCTANQLGPIPAPLRDRMEIIEIDGYTEQEKVEIAKQYLVPRQIKENGLRTDEVAFSDDALRRVIREYTYESGVRNLERQVGSVCRKVTTHVAEGHEGELTTIERERRSHLPGQTQVLYGRARRASPRSRRRRRTGGHDGRWGHYLCRGLQDGRQSRIDADRPAGRRDARVGASSPELRALPGPRSGDRGRGLCRKRDSHSRAGRRGAQGWAVRRRHDGHGPGIPADGTPDCRTTGDDRRDHPARPGFARRRHQAKSACRGAGRYSRRRLAQAQRSRSGRPSRPKSAKNWTLCSWIASTRCSRPHSKTANSKQPNRLNKDSPASEPS